MSARQTNARVAVTLPSGASTEVPCPPGASAADVLVRLGLKPDLHALIEGDSGRVLRGADQLQEAITAGLPLSVVQRLRVG